MLSNDPHSRMGAILDRLEGVKSTGHNRYLARCPAHDDRDPSLSLREMDDGRILIHDFGGCHADDVLVAIGLDWADIMPPSGHHLLPPAAIPQNVRRAESRKDRSERKALASAAMIVTLAAFDIHEGRQLSDDNLRQLQDARSKLAQAANHE